MDKNTNEELLKAPSFVSEHNALENSRLLITS